MFKKLLTAATAAADKPDAARRREITDKVFALMTRDDEARFSEFDDFKATFDADDAAFFAKLVAQMQPVVEDVRQKVAAAVAESGKGGAQ